VRHVNNGSALDWRSVDFVIEQSSLCAFDQIGASTVQDHPTIE
jgi:hypothetical protein